MSDSEQAKKRQKKTWVRVDTGEKSVDEHVENINDEITLSYEGSGKTYYKCKHHHCFGCKQAYRAFISGGSKALETAGAHVCNDATLENRTRGLPKHIKEKVEAEMIKDPKIRPKRL